MVTKTEHIERTEGIRAEYLGRFLGAEVEIKSLQAIIRALAPAGTPAEVRVRKMTTFEQAEAIYSSISKPTESKT